MDLAVSLEEDLAVTLEEDLVVTLEEDLVVIMEEEISVEAETLEVDLIKDLVTLWVETWVDKISLVMDRV